MSARAWCISILLASLMVPAVGQAASSVLNVEVEGLGGPFGDPPGAYNQYYWSGAFAGAMADGAFVIDDQTDVLGYPWPNMPALSAHAAIDNTYATAATSYGTAELDMAAVPGPTHRFAEAFGEVEHWIDFETSLPGEVIGARFEYSYDLETGGLFEVAYFEMYVWAELYEWVDDNSDGIRDDDEWYYLDDAEYWDLWFVADGDDDSWSYGDECWFDPVGPGVYSLGIGAWGGVGAATIPAPGALALASIGIAVAGWLRRHKRL